MDIDKDVKTPAWEMIGQARRIESSQRFEPVCSREWFVNPQKSGVYSYKYAIPGQK